jgi:hypothetical protein
MYDQHQNQSLFRQIKHFAIPVLWWFNLEWNGAGPGIDRDQLFALQECLKMNLLYLSLVFTADHLKDDEVGTIAFV